MLYCYWFVGSRSNNTKMIKIITVPGPAGALVQHSGNQRV